MVCQDFNQINNTIRHMLIQFEDMDPNNWLYYNQLTDLETIEVIHIFNDNFF